MRAWLLAIALVVLALVFGMTKSAVQKIRVAVIKPAGDAGIVLERCPGVSPSMNRLSPSLEGMRCGPRSRNCLACIGTPGFRE